MGYPNIAVKVILVRNAGNRCGIPAPEGAFLRRFVACLKACPDTNRLFTLPSVMRKWMIVVICLLPQLLMSQEKSTACSPGADIVTAVRVAHEISLNARHPAAEWRVNFFRVEGAREPRFYSAWRATNTPQPNFHVPEAFGKLRFQH